MRPDEFGPQLAELIDREAPPLTLADVSSASLDGNPRPTRLAVAGGLALVVVIVALVAVHLNREQEQDPVLVPPSSIEQSTTTSNPVTTPSPAPDVSLPIPIPDGNDWLGVSDEFLMSPDWTFLDPAPIEPRWPGVITWTGEEIVIWGGEESGGGGGLYKDGAAYDPQTGSWRLMAPPPVTMDNQSAWVWTEEELIIWGNRDAIAWNPASNTWRLIDDWPLVGSFYRRAVWTGESIIDLQAKLLVDPVTGESREIGGGPEISSASRATAVWTGRYAMWLTAAGAYDSGSNEWLSIPPDPLSDAATVGLAIDELTVFAVDYLMRSASFDFVANTWESGPVIPLRFYECTPRLHQTGSALVVETCSGAAALPDLESHWIPFGYPTAEDGWDLIAAGDDLYAWGEAGFAVLNEPTLLTGATPPQRLAFGIGYLDLPDGWRLDATSADVSAAVADVSDLVLIGPSGEQCVARTIHREARDTLLDLVPGSATVIYVDAYVGSEPYPALQYSNLAHHLTWPMGSGDVVDIACDDPNTTRELAERVWTAWG